MSLDLRALYPHLHAETTRHPSLNPRPTSSNGAGRNKRDTGSPQSPAKSTSSSRLLPPHANQRWRQTLTAATDLKAGSNNEIVSTADTLASPAAAAIATRGGRSMPPISVSTYNSGVLGSPLAPVSNHRGVVHEVSFIGASSKSQQPAKKEITPEEPHAAVYPAKTRSHVLRGDLARQGATTTTPHIQSVDLQNQTPMRTARTAPPLMLHQYSMASLANALPLEEIVQCTARPRSRYARREIATPIQPLPRRLSLTMSTPTLSQASDRTQTTSIRANTSAMRGSKSTSSIERGPTETQSPRQPQPRILSWTEHDASSFFLTEIDAKEVADQWKIAKALAHGSHLLYAQAKYDRAVARFADALTVAQEQEQIKPHELQSAESIASPLVALIHHHMGVAFFEDKQAKWALMMQKKALELAQQSGDTKLQARALKALGVLFLDRNDPDKALDCQQQALAIALETADVELEARVYANLGNLAAAQHQLSHSIACHERDLATSSSSQVDSAVGQARAHRNLSLVYAKMDGMTDRQLDHELQAARLETTNVFESDIRRHAGDVVGNIYLQLTTPDARLADMVTSSLQDVLSAKENEDAGCSIHPNTGGAVYNMKITS